MFVNADLESLLKGDIIRPGMMRDFKHEVVAAYIVQKLGETEPEPIAKVSELVVKLGRVVAMNMLKATFDIEAKGGMMTYGREPRRRAIGGVWFTLAARRLARLDKVVAQKLAGPSNIK